MPRLLKPKAAPSSPESTATVIVGCFGNASSASKRSTTAAGEAETSRGGTAAAARANAAAVKQDVGRVDAESQGVGSVRDSLRLVSPVDGVIVSREAEPGTTVVAGQAVVRVVAPESLWVRARVDQSRAQGVQVGQPASIVLRSAPGNPDAGPGGAHRNAERPGDRGAGRECELRAAARAPVHGRAGGGHHPTAGRDRRAHRAQRRHRP